MRLPLALALLLACTVCVSHAFAQDPLAYEEQQEEPPSARDVVFAYNTGLRIALAPGVFIPTHGGRVGFFIAGDVRYGFKVGPMVIAPGVRPAAYFPSHNRIITGLGTLRLTFPVGPVGPFIVGGGGVGWVRKPSHVGVAYLGGGGFMVHIGTSFGIGVEATYQAITGTDFKALFVGPLLLLAF